MPTLRRFEGAGSIPRTAPTDRAPPHIGGSATVPLPAMPPVDTSRTNAQPDGKPACLASCRRRSMPRETTTAPVPACSPGRHLACYLRAVRALLGGWCPRRCCGPRTRAHCERSNTDRESDPHRRPQSRFIAPSGKFTYAGALFVQPCSTSAGERPASLHAGDVIVTAHGALEYDRVFSVSAGLLIDASGNRPWGPPPTRPGPGPISGRRRRRQLRSPTLCAWSDRVC